jgi:hypothetical protein
MAANNTERLPPTVLRDEGVDEVQGLSPFPAPRPFTTVAVSV